MKKIESYEQCNLLIKKFKKNNSKLVSNFFFMPKELKDIVANREVGYQENKESLIFCVEEKDFTHVFFFAKAESVLELEDTGKVMILDLVERNTGDLKGAKLEERSWIPAGFKEYKQYVRLRYSIKIEIYIKMDTYQYKNYDFLCAKLVDVNMILDLWTTNLDKYSTPLPNKKDVERIVKSGHVYVAKQNGTVMGAVYMNAASKSCILNHLVIHPASRRQGLATMLMTYALKMMALEDIERCYLWVDVNNTPAYENYKKYGFEEDGLWSRQLMR